MSKVPFVPAHRRETFDRDRSFIAAKTFQLSGKSLTAGAPIAKANLTTRLLRQLYDNRSIVMTDAAQEEPALLTIPEKPNFEALSLEGLRAWLKTQGAIPRPRTTKSQLLDLCNVKWQEHIDGLASAHRDSKHSSECLPGQVATGHAS